MLPLDLSLCADNLAKATSTESACAIYLLSYCCRPRVLRAPVNLAQDPGRITPVQAFSKGRQLLVCVHWTPRPLILTSHQGSSHPLSETVLMPRHLLQDWVANHGVGKAQVARGCRYSQNHCCGSWKPSISQWGSKVCLDCSRLSVDNELRI